MRSKTCCFTGHRALSQEELSALQKAVLIHVQRLIAQGYTRFLCGGANGFDALCADVILNLQKEYPFLELVLMLPYPKATPHPLLEYANECFLLSDHYFQGCFHNRNRAMVDRSSVCICYCRNSSSGTAYTRSYALKQGLLLLEV